MIKADCDILLIHPHYHRRLFSGVIPPLGLAYLASSLQKAGFVSKIIDCSVKFDSLNDSSILKMKKWLSHKLIQNKPRLAIGIGPCTTSAIKSIIAVAEVCNSIFPELPTIFGGPLTLVPDQEWLFFEKLNAFAVVKGDGEYALSNLLNNLNQGKSSFHIEGVQTNKNLNIKPTFVQNLDSLPSPAWHLFDIKNYESSIRRSLLNKPTMSMIGSRGCIHKCKYCISGSLNKYRKHSFEFIARQAQILKTKYDIQSLIFYDDNLFPLRQKINEELKLFAEILYEAAPGLFWQIEMRPDVFSEIQEDTFDHIYSRGCRQINIGVEKIPSSQLDYLSKNFNKDKFMNNSNVVMKVCPEMRLSGTFIIGGPGETPDTINQTIEFSTQLNLLFALYYPLELYPGTELYMSIYGNDNKIWFDKIMNDDLPWGELIYENDKISVSQLIDFTYLAYRRFYERQDWHNLAKSYLGSHYRDVWPTIKSWQYDRFRINQRKK